MSGAVNEDEAKKVIEQIGKQLKTSKACPSKTVLIKLLKQARSAFPKLKQSESLKPSVNPLRDSLIRHGLFDHKDKDVRLLVGICICDIIRVLAPKPKFSDADCRDIFRLFISIFAELNDASAMILTPCQTGMNYDDDASPMSPYFSDRVKILETVAKLRFCVVMLDTGCEDLVLKMFKTFFTVVREYHPQSLINSMLSIITSILDEKVKADSDPLERNTLQALLDVILQNAIKEREGVTSASFRLAVSVIQNCGEKLERCICQFLISCILDRDAVGSVIKESYHEIILEIYQTAPELLLSVIPYLTHELQTDQVDVRIKALNLIRKLLSLSGKHFVREYPHIFSELVNRLSDKSAEVRLTALHCAKALCLIDPSGRESPETLSAIRGRLLDHDDKVRMEAVNVVCELAKINFKPKDFITQAAERLRDKKVLVRSQALRKLVELYQEYCTKCAAGKTSLNEHIEEIPCKFLMLCYEKDCLEFRSQSMELVLADLFPASLSIEETTRHWIFIFSLFKPPHIKALKTILSQKRRLRDGLKEYLDLWNRAEDNGSGEAERKFEELVVKMSSCFPDYVKAKDCFLKLRELKDNEIFSVLQQLIREGTTVDFETMKDIYLREPGDRKTLSEFFHLLFKKCSFNIFGSEHVHYIVNCLSSDEAENKQLKNYQVQLLLIIVSVFPSFLRGSEKQFLRLLLERDILFNEQLIEMLAREGRHIPIRLSDIYPCLEKVCLEETRSQSKLAVTAIASLADTSEQFIFSELCKTLVDSLCNGRNVPTVLQSLGIMAQHSISTFEAQEKVITHYIVEEIFQQNDVLASKDLELFDETSNFCSSCKLKVFGLKTLVRSFLPHKHACLNRPIKFLVDIIQQMLQNSGFFTCSVACESDEAFIRLAAAKAVLRLSRKWDLHFPPQMFRLTILMAKDHSPLVRRSFARKIHNLLKNHAVPNRYACAFSFSTIDPLEDVRNDALKYLEAYVQKYGKGAQMHETTTVQGAANHPVYLLVFLIHVLAHDPDFPAPDCRDEKIYAQFLSPLFITVQALVNEYLVDGNLPLKSNASSYLRNILIAIKRAEDAVDAQMTPKLHLLAEVGISILDSLNTNYTPGTHSPGLILLPSSFYRGAPSRLREASSYPLIGPDGDASFSKKIISCLKTEVFEIGKTGIKHGQQFSRPSGIRYRRSNSKSGNTDILLVNKTKEHVDELHTGQKEQFDPSNCEVATRGQQNPASSSNHRSVLFHNKSIDDSTDERNAPRNLRAKPCDSATAELTLPLKTGTLSCSREEDTVVKCAKRMNHLTSKINSNGEALVGKHIKLWSPIEKCYYAGIVDSFDSTENTHQITYKTGEVDVLSLDSETWEIDLDDSQAQRGGNSSGSSANDHIKIHGARGYDSKQEKLLRKRAIPVRNVSQAEKRTKRREDAAIDTSTSEVINVSSNNMPRTRRQKV